MSAGGATIARLRFEFLGDLKGYRESLTTAETEGNAAAKTWGRHSATPSARRRRPAGSAG